MAGDEGSAEPLGRFPALRTHDVDEAESVVSEAYVPHRLTAGEGLDARLNVVHTGALTVGYLAYGAQARLTVPPMADSFHLNLTLTGATRVRQGRAEAPTRGRRSGVMVAPAQACTVDWAPDAAQFAVKIRRRSLESQLSVLLHDAVVRPLRFALGVDLQSPPGAALLAGTHFLAGQLELQEPLEGFVRQQMESFLLTQVLLGVPNTYSARLRSDAGPMPRSVLDDVIDYIEAYPERPLGLAELAAVAGTSASAVRSAFRAALDTTPAQYVSAVRLGRAHVELVDGRPEAAAPEQVATRWGFPSVASFVRAYTSHYGHPPAGPAAG